MNKRVNHTRFYKLIFLVFPLFFTTCGIPVSTDVNATKPTKIPDNQINVADTAIPTDVDIIGFRHTIDKAYDENRYYIGYTLESSESEPRGSDISRGLTQLDYSVSPSITIDSSGQSELFLLGIPGEVAGEGSTLNQIDPTLSFSNPGDFDPNATIEAIFTRDNNTSDGSIEIHASFDTPVSFDEVSNSQGIIPLKRVVFKISNQDTKPNREKTEVKPFDPLYSTLVSANSRTKYADVVNLPVNPRENEDLYIHLYVLYEVRSAGVRAFNSGGFIYFGTLNLSDLIN